MESTMLSGVSLPKFNYKSHYSVLHLPQDGFTCGLRLRQQNSSQNWIVAETSDSKFGRNLERKSSGESFKKNFRDKIVIGSKLRKFFLLQGL